jgi:hypothetical protein
MRATNRKSKGPRDPARFEGRKSQKPRTLLGMRKTTARVPVVGEPAEDHHPAAAVPAEERDVKAAARAPQNRAGEGNVVALHVRGYLLPLPQIPQDNHEIGQAEVGSLGLGPPTHLLTAHGDLSLFEDRQELEIVDRLQGRRHVLDDLVARGNDVLGELLGREELALHGLGRDERLGEFLHLGRVVRGDECREQLVAELALEMGRATQGIHCRFLLPPLHAKAFSSPTWQRGSTGFPAFFQLQSYTLSL